MNIYLDFEANSGNRVKEIISIGAITEKGDCFYSLVKPHVKLGRKTKKLTNISQRELDNSPDIRVVITMFYAWLTFKYPKEEWTFLVYGDKDKKYLSDSMTFLSNDDKYVRKIFEEIYKDIKRADTTIAKKLGKNRISLREAYMMCGGQLDRLVPHNALEDAKMLKYVWEKA